MSHIFISYSRQDIDFVSKIVQALAENNLKAWIDWESLPKGEDWQQEIYRGIEEADAFLFLISPDSVKSQYCRQEIEHALRSNKRILPILIRDTAFKDTHPEISKRNWTFCREGQDDFNQGIGQTCQAIRTDYEWLKYHTELQIKALKWGQKKDTSRLLRGRELGEIEQQLAHSGDKDPQPTDLQREYVLASRKAEERWRRQIITGLTIAFLVVSILCIAAVTASFIAVGQRNLAISKENARATAQAIAEEQASIALARQLVAQAQLVYNQQANGPLIASLLAIESQIRVPNAEADEIIRNSSDLLPLPYKNIPVPSSELTTTIVFSPDGRLIATGDFDHSARVWDTNSGKEIALLPHNDRVYRVQFSADSQKLFTASGDGTIRVWEIASGTQITQLDHGMGFAYFGLSADGTKMVSGGVDGMVEVWNTETMRKLSRFENRGAVAAVGISPDGYLIASTSEDNSATVWDSRNGKEIIRLNFEIFAPQSIRFSPDGKQVLLGGYYGPPVEVWNIQTGSLDFKLSSEGVGIFSPTGEIIAIAYRSGVIEIRNSHSGNLIRTVTHNFAVQDLSFSPDSRYLASSSDDGSTRLWNIDSGREVSRMLQDGEVLANAFSPNGRLIASAGVDKTIHLWQLPSVHGSLLQSTDQLRANARIDPAGKWIAAWDGSGATLQIIDVLTNAKRMQINSASPLLNVEFSPNSELIALSGVDGTVCIWKISKQEKSICHTQNEPTAKVRFSSDSKWAASTEGRTIQVWDTETGREISKLASNYLISTFAFSPDRKWMAVGAAGDYKIELWDILSDKKITELQHDPTVNISEVIFSLDGRWLISSGMDGTARVWDMQNMREQSRLTYDPTIYENRYEVLTTKVSPDQKKLVSVNTITHMTANNNPTTTRESEIRVWDLLSGQIIIHMVHNAWVSDVDWSPDGQYIFSIGVDGTVKIWGAASGSELAHIRHGSEIIQFRFTSDSKQIISIQADGTYELSTWQSSDIVTQTCLHLPRNLTLLEWNQYFGDIVYHATCPDVPIPTR